MEKENTFNMNPLAHCLLWNKVVIMKKKCIDDKMSWTCFG